jgi:hypothetical protein
MQGPSRRDTMFAISDLAVSIALYSCMHDCACDCLHGRNPIHHSKQGGIASRDRWGAAHMCRYMRA